MATIATPLQQRLAAVRAGLQKAGADARRPPGSVRLVAVSKTFPAAAIREVADAGQVDFGENYAQEAVEKMASLGDLKLVWHSSGPSRATRPAPSRNTSIGCTRSTGKNSAPPVRPAAPAFAALQVCIAVNLSGEASKSGVPRQELAGLARAVAALPRLRLRGLMVIPEPGDDMALRRQRFAELRGLLDSLKRDGLELDTLSMGMSADVEVAVAEGATMVRIARPYLEKGRGVEDHLYRRRQYGPGRHRRLVQKGFAAQDIGVVEVLAEQRARLSSQLGVARLCRCC